MAAMLALFLILYGCRPPVPTSPELPSLDVVDQEFSAYVTGYSYWDNTPPQSKAIARPMIHKEAGGHGTYDDPVTLAVGHRIDDGVQSLDFPAGTLFYFPSLLKYAIVEDVCGNAPLPQYRPCHIGSDGLPWLDIYIGGDSVDAAKAEQCARQITGIQTVVLSPGPNRKTKSGTIIQSACSALLPSAPFRFGKRLSFGHDTQTVQ